MRKTKRALLFYVCALALIATGIVGIDSYAQDKQQEKSSQTKEHNVIIQTTGDGTATFGVRVPGPQEGGIGFQKNGFGWSWVSETGQGEHTAQFISTEMSFDNKVVKGAPFSGEMVYESIHTLADGNRIVNRSATTIHRDSQGRTRREQPFIFFSNFGSAGNNDRKSIQIFDPVDGSTYILDAQARTARKLMTGGRFGGRIVAPSPAGAVEGTSGQIRLSGNVVQHINVAGGVLQGNAIKRVQPDYPQVAKAARAQGSVQVRVSINENGEVTTAEVTGGHPLLRDAALEAAKQWKFKPTMVDGRVVNVQGILTFNFVLTDKENDPPVAGAASAVAAAPPAMVAMTAPLASARRINVESKTESLGKQTIDGVEAEGTRVVETIPAGAIGNERPIEIIREHWYSPELQMVVLTRSVDPRAGETTMRLTNINRSEPDATLFQVPSDYTVFETPGPMFDKIDEIKKRRPNNQ
ncbi:MAG: energy transducer TonB [Acidobacteria bacterium]|nr:energy transducer TonB [Acidobacteriota bacterium]